MQKLIRNKLVGTSEKKCDNLLKIDSCLNIPITYY